MIVCSCFVYLNLDLRSRSHLFHSPTFYFCGVVAFSRPHFELIRIIPHGNKKTCYWNNSNRKFLLAASLQCFVKRGSPVGNSSTIVPVKHNCNCKCLWYNFVVTQNIPWIKAIATKQEKYISKGFRSISNPFRTTFINYPNIEKENPLSNMRVSFITKLHKKNIPPLRKPLLVTTDKIWTYRERNFLLCRLKSRIISQCTSLKQENIQKSGCLPLIKVRAFEHSSCLFFIPST